MLAFRYFSALFLACCTIGFSLPAFAQGNPGDGREQIRQVVSFGDSLSDVGTYAYAKKFGGGGYTTNPSPISIQNIAAHYNTTVAPAITGGFGQVSVAHPDGLGYAQGGARVANPPNPGAQAGDTGELQTPITAQVAAYLDAHQSFNAHQLVFIQGGANDIQDAYNNWAYMVSAGATPTAAFQAVSPSVQQTAQQLAGLVQKLIQHGAIHVVLLNVPDISKAPIAAVVEQSIPGSARVLRKLAQVFNAELEGALPASPALLRIDAFAFIDRTAAAYRGLGFEFDGSKGSNVACGPAQLPPQYQANAGSALFCSPANYVAPEADRLYMFADTYHPTTHLQQLISDYVIRRTDPWLAGDAIEK